MTLYQMRLVDDTIGSWLLRAIAFFMSLKRFFTRSKQAIYPHNVRHILCQKYFGMGSILHTIPIIKALRDQYPNAKIIYMTLDSNRDTVELCKIADEVLYINLNSVPAFVKTTLTSVIYLLKKKVDISIDFEYFAKFSMIVSVLVLAKMRVGLYLKKIRPSGILTKKVYYNHYKHISDIYFAFGEVLGIKRKPEYFSDLLPSFQSSFCTLRKKMGFEENKPLITMNVNASALFPFRKWPAPNFVKLAGLLMNKYPQFHYVMIGGDADRDYVTEICEKIALAHGKRLFNCAGRTNVQELFALIEMSSLFITNDSGPLHIASLYNKNIVAFFGPESPVTFGPLNDNALVLYSRETYCSPCLNVYDSKKSLYGEVCSENKCLTDISPEKVFELIEKRFLTSQEVFS